MDAGPDRRYRDVSLHGLKRSFKFREFGRRERIRTSDPFVPNEVRYQAALHADKICQ